jgi:transcriptional regulator with XRE-family HTH domain
MNKVKETRTKLGLTQAKLAAMTGGTLTQGDISKLETSYYRKPTPKIRREVAKALGIPETELFPQNGE